ncbi:hypothetical protein PVT67_17315 [Gallaecimonas kandeliae]|uniref:tetratricopeptide repeat protein n=1 Tax=Gallaecimonas kandeliae TaxID=3029055 RepID=UPI0026488A6B|nr:hypothetical protein [Gallaecimonas kandeliae]WKE65402.1 hypothetical protein PVT67_17315 [Gallaecimonas kandeliae]
MKWLWLLLCMPGLTWASAVVDLRQAMAHSMEPKYRSRLTSLVAPALAEAEAGGDPKVLGEVLYIKANIESRVSRHYQQSLATLAEAAKTVAALEGDDAFKVQMEIWIEQGSLNQYLGQFDQAQHYFQYALDQASARHAKRAEAQALYRLGQLQYRRNDIVPALNYLDEASLRLLEEDDPALRLDILSTKGRIFRLNHAFDKALSFLQQALALAQQQQMTKEVPDLLVGLAVTYQEQGDSNSALLESLHALDLYRDQHRTLSEAKVLLNIASLYLDDPQQRLKALEYLDQAVDIYRRNKVNFYLGTALSMRAPLLTDPQGAVADLKEALGHFAERDDVSSWREREKAQERLADIYQQQGLQDQAIAALRAAMALKDKLDSDDLKDGRQAMEQLTEQVNQSDRLRQSEQQRLDLAKAEGQWRLSALLAALLALAAALAATSLWRSRQGLRLALAEDRQRMTHNPQSGLINRLGVPAALAPLLEASQQDHNRSREAGGTAAKPLVLVSLDPHFLQRLPLLAGSDQSREALHRYVARLQTACQHCALVAQLSDRHLLLVLKDEAFESAALYRRLADLTSRFVAEEGLEDGRMAVGFNLFPTLAQRSTALPVPVLLELARFTLAQAGVLLEETRQGSWVSLLALELAPPSLLDVDDPHRQLQQALDRGLLQLRSGH